MFATIAAKLADKLDNYQSLIIKLLFVSSCIVSSAAFAVSEDELLDPTQAFTVFADHNETGILQITYNIAEGYYLYRHRLNYQSDTLGVNLADASIPAGKKKIDDWFGEVEIYRHSLTVKLPFSSDNPDLQEMLLNAGLQGCADVGVCYPPQVAEVPVALNASLLSNTIVEITEAAATPDNTDTTSSPSSKVSEQDQIANTLAQGKTWLTILSFFGFGLLLAFTPCVFPMIPILSGIIAGQGSNITTQKAFVLSVVYVLAMALTYTIVGVIVGASGENIQAIFQNPWVLGSFAAIFVLLSLSMFGFYELQMPNAIQSKLTSISNKQEGGTLIGAAIMGFLSALIVGPCVTAPLIGALIYIADTGDMLLGGIALFSLSMGMGTPLVLIGTSAGKLLPRAGAWMDAVKAVFGVMLIGVAIWLLERVLPIAATMALFAILLITSAIYMGALEAAQTGWQKLWKGLGIIILIYGILLLIGAASGSGSLLQPIQFVQQGNGSHSNTKHLSFEQIKGLDGLEAALASAEQSNQAVMLDFYADWCVSCKEMEAFTFTDKAVQASLANFKLIQADVTPNDELDQALLKSLGLFGPPAILFYTPDSTELRNFRVVGYMPATEFNNHVQAFITDASLNTAEQQVNSPALLEALSASEVTGQTTSPF